MVCKTALAGRAIGQYLDTILQLMQKKVPKRLIHERRVGSSRPRKKNSMIATTSGMLARKQMMVSTGTYCKQQRPIAIDANFDGLLTYDATRIMVGNSTLQRIESSSFKAALSP